MLDGVSLSVDSAPTLAGDVPVSVGGENDRLANLCQCITCR